MKRDLFVELCPNVESNEFLRIPQRDAFAAISKYFSEPQENREVGVVLPVGCGKSGLLCLAPFAVKSKRALLIAPGLDIADQLFNDLRFSDPNSFYRQRHVISNGPFPEPAEIRGNGTNKSDCDAADIVVTNIQQLQGDGNRWITAFDSDYFDLILFDEGHHGVADSWISLREKFPQARIVSVSATPIRADGRKMAGEIIYAYPIIEAVRNGYVKRVSGLRLNPSTLSYVRRDDGQEISVGLDEVRSLGEEDADFRRAIVSSERSLETIVDASIDELNRLRKGSGESRLKIIASALNMEHCIQIVERYRAKGFQADYVHSRVDSATNRRVRTKLDNHELDVIVQVRKLNEGFDHPYLAVAAVFSIFANLGPFMQFVGRIMRVLPGKPSDNPANHGVVVFHVGGNITGVWDDFKDFAEADQEVLGQLLDAHFEGETYESRTEVLNQGVQASNQIPKVIHQGKIELEELELLTDENEAQKAMLALADHGISPEQYKRFLEAIPATKQDERKARRATLSGKINNEAGKILNNENLKVNWYRLSGGDPFSWLVSRIHTRCNEHIGSLANSRSEFSADDYDAIERAFDEIVNGLVNEIQSATT